MTVRYVARVVVFLFCGGPTLYAQTSQPALSAAWTWESKQGLEWAALAGRGQAQTILIAMRDAHLQLLDPATGRPRLAEPAATARDVKLVPAALSGAGGGESCGDDAVSAGPPDVAYYYDRHSVCAIRLSDPSGLQWQYGRWPSMGEEFPGEPDTLTGWILAQVANAGIVLVNSDGRVVLLAHADGSVRWQVQLEPLRVARLHVRGNTAAVMWRAVGKVQVAFLRLDAQPPEAPRRELGELWPVWSKLLPDGLLTIGPGSAVLYPPEGVPHKFDLPAVGSETLAADAIQFPVADVRVGDELPPLHTLLVVGEGGAPAAYDFSAGRRLWPKRREAADGQQVYALSIHSFPVVTLERWGSAAYDPVTGDILARCWCEKCPMQWAGSGLTGRFLNAVGRAITDSARHVILVRAELGSAKARAADPARFTPRVFELQSASEVRRVLWPDQRAVLIEPNGLRAYTLP